MTGKPSSVGRRDSGIAGWLLGLIFVCLATGIVAAGTFYYRNHEKNYRAQVDRQLSAIADLKVDELVQWRKERLADGAVFFRNGSFSDLVRRFIEKPEDAEAQREIQVWVEKYLTLNQYDHVHLLDTQGVTRLSSPAGLPAISSIVARNVSEVLRSGQVTLEDFYRSEQDQRVHLGVLVPILDELGAGRPLGVLVLRIDPETYLYPFIQRWPTPSLTAETLLVRREYNQVVFLNELRFQKNTALTLRRSLDQMAMPAARAASGREGIMEGLDYRGVPVVAALRTIPDSPWSLVARMDTAEVYAPLREQLRLVVGLISALLLGAAGGVGLIWRQQRARYYRTKYEAAEARARLAAIVESSEDAIIGKSLDGTITSWNASAERLFGYRAEEMIGQPVTRLIPPDDQPWEAEILNRLRRGERVEHYEAVRLAKDGRPVAVSLTISPVLDAAGTIIGAAKIVRDITGLKRAGEMMRDLAARYRALFNESNDGMLVTDVETKTFKYANPAMCRMLGYTEDELRTMGMPDIHPQDALQSVIAKFEAQARGDKTLAEDVPCLRKDGSVIHTDISGAKITVDGRPCNVGFFRDITERKRAEEALRNSESMLNEMGRIAEVGGWEMDLLTRQAHWTKGTYDIVEISYGEPVPGPDEHVSYYLPEHRPIVESAMKKLIEEDIPLDFEAKLCTAKGNIKWCRALGQAVRKDGVCIKVYGTFQNITERKRAEEALRELAARYRALFNESTDGILIADIGPTTFKYANPALCRMLGYTEDELRTMGVPDIHPKETVPRVVAEFEALARGDKTLATDIPCLRKNGSVFHADVGAVKITVDGRPCNVGFFRDITERKRAEEALRTSEREFRSLAEAMPQIVWVTRADGWNIYFNQRWVDYTGLTLEESYGHGWNIPFHPDDRQRAWDAWQRATKHYDPYELECRLRRADGVYRWWLIRGVPLRNENGEILKWFGTCTDIEDLKQAEGKIQQLNAELEQRVRDRTADLEAANRELEAFSYSVSHDLRAPLRAMDGFSMALLEDCAGRLDETAQDHLRRIRAGSQQMAELIDDLLNLSRESRAEMRRERVDLTVLTHEIAAEFQRTHPDRKVQLVVAPALTADADARMLRLVFNNLLENAWKFTSRCAQARIEVGALEQDGQRIFFVRDNGVGFDMAYAGKLFGAFQRLHAAADFPGTGIGLATVQRIIHRHGGRVWAEGAVGQGATVYFTLGPKAVRLEAVRPKAEEANHA